MMNQCEGCGRYSSITVYDLVTHQEVCLRCDQQLVHQIQRPFWTMGGGERQSLPKAA
jgi:hypothetical protein